MRRRASASTERRPDSACSGKLGVARGVPVTTSPVLSSSCLAALPELHTWSGRPDADTLKALPSAPAVYLLIDEQSRPVQLATTQSLRRLSTARLADAEREKRGREDLAAVARGVRWRVVGSPFEARWWYYRLAREMHAREYRKLISFGPAWFLHVNWDKPVPEIRVSERVWRDAGEFLGPWPSRRQAQAAVEGLWNLFDLCRYPEQVRKAPHGERCAYAEMGRCDAPCDGGVPLTAYVERTRAAWRFAAGAIDAWITSAEQTMRAAARELAFERAALLKEQLAFARHWRSMWSAVVRPLAEYNWLLLLPVTRRKAWKPFVLARGVLRGGAVLQDRKLAGGVCAWLAADALVDTEGNGAAESDTVRMEQTWLVAHFLQHREADAAIRVPLPDLKAPDELEPLIAADLDRRRAE